MLEVANGVLLIPVMSLVGDATVIQCVPYTMIVVMMLLPQYSHMVRLK